MKRRKIGLVLLAAALLVLYQFIPADPTEADLGTIRRLVGKRTSEEVWKIEPLLSGSVKVTTGWIKGPLSGGGHEFKMRKFFGLWVVYSSSEFAI
jgi:hypothetical protein